jgi:hypothetical protein
MGEFSIGARELADLSRKFDLMDHLSAACEGRGGPSHGLLGESGFACHGPIWPNSPALPKFRSD